MVCDASTFGLEAALEQLTEEKWVLKPHAPEFLNSVEEKHSEDELELLGFVRSIERLKFNLYGKHFTVITDHQA